MCFSYQIFSFFWPAVCFCVWEYAISSLFPFCFISHDSSLLDRSWWCFCFIWFSGSSWKLTTLLSSAQAALIMQVLQLTADQIAMLPPEQRQSILILKEQIQKSTGAPWKVSGRNGTRAGLGASVFEVIASAFDNIMFLRPSDFIRFALPFSSQYPWR